MVSLPCLQYIVPQTIQTYCYENFIPAVIDKLFYACWEILN